MNLKQQLNTKPNLQKHLFERGYLITDDDYSGALHDYPFYGNWKEYVFGDYRFYVYQTVSAFFQQIGNRTFFLIGHAYNPYTMEPDENKLLQYIGKAYGTDAYFERLDELTGLFIFGSVCGKCIEFTVDASGMQYGC